MTPDRPEQSRFHYAPYDAQVLGKLFQEGNQLRTLIDHIPDYIYFKDAHSRFVDANKATYRIMKCKSPEELIGKTDFDFYPKEFAENFFRDEQEIFLTGQSKLNIEETVVNEDGQLRFLSTSKIALKDENGKIIGLVGIGRDITERKQAEDVLKRDKETFEKLLQERTAKLLEAQDEIRRIQRLSDMGVLAAMVAHELRNPLGAINLAVNSIRKKHDVYEQTLELVEKSLMEGNRIIDNLLNYSRIQAPCFTNVDIIKILDESVEVLLSQDENKHIRVKKHYDTQNSNLIKADSLQLKEILVNLLNNAAQAIHKPNGLIEITVIRLSDEVTVSIKDNGKGIAPDDLEKVFLPFFTRKAKGTGLGLAICKELVELHRGRIQVTSQAREGTEFKIVLPVNR